MKRLALILCFLLLLPTPAWPTVNEVDPARNDYVASGSNQDFNTTYKVNAKGDLRVYVSGVLKVVDTDYTVSNLGVSGGATVHFLAAPAANAAVAILRKQAAAQTSTYQAGEAFPATRIGGDLDDLTMQVQQDRETLRRSIRAPAQDALDMVLPTVASRASKYLAFDSNGSPTAVAAGTTSGSIDLSTVTATGSTNARSLATRFAETRNVLDFTTGGAGTSVSPWTGFETAINALAAGSHIYFPTGYYALSAKITMQAGWTITGDGWGSVIKVGTLADDMIYATGVSNLTLRNLQVDATGQTGNDSHGIKIINGANILIDGLWVHHAANDDIRIGPSGSNNGNVDGVRITNCNLSYAGQVGPGGMGIGMTDAGNFTITNNWIHNNVINGMDIEATNGTGNYLFLGAIVGNTITSNTANGIVIYDGSVSYDNFSRITIAGNVISGGNTYGIYLLKQSNVVITGNELFNGVVNIYVEGSVNTTISGNDITHGTTGISFVATSVGAMVSGNTISNATTGINVSGGSSDIITGVNRFSTVTTHVSGVNEAGAWKTPSYNGANFYGNGSMTWTVASGDVTTYQWTLTDDVLTVNFALEATTVGGTPDTTLEIDIPNSYVAQKSVVVPYTYVDKASAMTAGYAKVDAGAALIKLYKADGLAWQASTDQTSVYGSITFAVSHP